MQHEYERQQARAFEAGGNLAAAKAIYESILRRDDSQLGVRLRLSALEQVRGQYRKSREHVLAAAQLVMQGRRWKDLSKVGRRLLSFDEHALVHELIMHADWQSVDVLTQSAVLSQQLWLTQHSGDALELIAVASARTQPSHLLSYSRANALRHSGRMAEATAEYERCLTLAPNYPDAHWSLAYHQESDPPLSRVARIRKAQTAFAKESIEQAYLCYALFKEFDDAGEIDDAWAALSEGARIKRSSFEYDPHGEQQGLVALQALADADFVRGQAPESQSRCTPIFIVGLPRTGTTVMERILGNHSQVASVGELNDFTSALCWSSDGFLGVPMDAAAVGRMRDVDFTQVGREYMRRTRSSYGNCAFLIDKNPLNVFQAGLIARALPRAIIICMIRNPMDACFSNLKALFSGNAYGYSYDLAELADHHARFREMVEHWRRVMPDRFHVVQYEQLVADPLTTSEAVMRLCGLAMEPDCIDITRNESPVSTASSSQVRRPINRHGVDAWQRYSNRLEPLSARLRAWPESPPAAETGK